MAKILAAQSILNSSGVGPGATKRVVALVAPASCIGASHSSENKLVKANPQYIIQPNTS